MPYARTFVKVNINGHFGASSPPGVETWTTGFHVSSVGGGSFDPANLLAFITAIAPAVQAYHTTPSVGAGTATYLDGLSAAYIGTDGLYVLGALQPTTIYTLGAPVAGSGSPNAPYSQAVAITLRSLRLRGPASHGRMYWPNQSQGINGATGVILASVCVTIATAAQTMMNAINAQAASKFGTGSNVVLVSKIGAGTEAVVTSVGIGGKLDRMESRERNLLENHQYKTLTVTALLEQERDRALRDGYEDLDEPAVD